MAIDKLSWGPMEEISLLIFFVCVHVNMWGFACFEIARSNPERERDRGRGQGRSKGESQFERKGQCGFAVFARFSQNARSY